jgi:hypothetical protein
MEDVLTAFRWFRFSDSGKHYDVFVSPAVVIHSREQYLGGGLWSAVPFGTCGPNTADLCWLQVGVFQGK